MSFKKRHPEYLQRIERVLDTTLPAATLQPTRLHKAMRYSVLGGGKRIRPLLVYATGEALGVATDLLDAPAAAIEMMHAFSLVHDDLPAMDDDDLRRGQPTTHRAFDEATAILAADALQPLAFQILAQSAALRPYPLTQTKLIGLLAEACGSKGMTGGQTMDVATEGQQPDPETLEHIYRLKTGCLLRASVLSAALCPPGTDTNTIDSLERFIDATGLAFQIRDDILDIEGTTEQIGKQQGADSIHNKITYPALLGLEKAKARAEELRLTALNELDKLALPTDGLRWLADFIVMRTT
ncbi:MAG: polyprenyl synthetase family protein [Gammaproteobacteria bacterium]|nr:geranyl transferase [Chromatiales bacterium]MCP4926757.1 geranyl transferase [Gammaproteobacteria bacterium]MDP7153683.1 polyprenyl synthetase family protein [Gammaproteobacteria bacterium]MDP7296725.1 polyprenyl synthetase family protein [Gammaproteobacteria bacterium]MDP7419051.1 polyprenyl synthetase family protein [Gammaproteobacteria bacterium]